MEAVAEVTHQEDFQVDIHQEVSLVEEEVPEVDLVVDHLMEVEASMDITYHQEDQDQCIITIYGLEALLIESLIME